MAKTICIIRATYRDALYFSERYINDNRHNILKISKTPSYIMVQMLNGEMHYFMSSYLYYFWCKGRTYELDGKMYHSGYLLKEIKMTKNELIDIINKKIDEYTNKRIEKLKKLEKEYSNHSQHMEAFMYHFIQNESLSMRANIESELNDLIQSLDLGVDNSHYYEMWRELKDTFTEKMKDYEKKAKNCGEKEFYLSAASNTYLKLGIGEAIEIMEEFEEEKRNDK